MDVGPHGAVEAEHGAGGEASLPKVVAVFEAAQVKGPVARLAVARQMAMAQARRECGQVRAGRKRVGGHAQE
jgi:hypothetical protein